MDKPHRYVTEVKQLALTLTILAYLKKATKTEANDYIKLLSKASIFSKAHLSFS